MNGIDLSILICSVHTRYLTYGRDIQAQVWPQYSQLPEHDQARVEIIMLTDNKKIMLGEKRNVMVDMAQGRYVQFIDDDDRIASDMFAELLHAIDTDPADVITFLVSVSMNGDEPKLCEYSIRFEENRNLPDKYERLPNHICCVKRSIARQASFPNVVYGEDAVYGQLIRPHLSSEHHIPKTLYFYDWSPHTTETQILRPGSLRMRNTPPLVDVVISSKADTPKMRAMTQTTINTCISGANSLPVHIVVIEQCEGVRYRHAQTVYTADEFNYNHFANRGAALGFAPWIMVANNDLIFRDGWLHQLLAADHSVMSPKCPGDDRQKDITENTTGYDTGMHLSGWCFMVSRQFWHEIGGFDEGFTGWCSDDVVVEQARAHGTPPMLVPGSVVEHLRSETLNRASNHDELTWGQITKFNARFGANKFADDLRFQEWKRKMLLAGDTK